MNTMNLSELVRINQEMGFSDRELFRDRMMLRVGRGRGRKAARRAGKIAAGMVEVGKYSVDFDRLLRASRGL